jgi:mono/diheme cytochrome c family protein
MNGIALTATEIQAIADYLNSGTKPTDGAGLYAAFCASCHGAGGSGGPEGSVTGASASKINEYINKESAMQSLGNLLTNTDISLIAGYLNSGNGNNGD